MARHVESRKGGFENDYYLIYKPSKRTRIVPWGKVLLKWANMILTAFYLFLWLNLEKFDTSGGLSIAGYFTNRKFHCGL